MIGISGKRYMAQRLAWLYVNGVWPDEINFINGVKGDNRLENLREAHRADNVRNRGMQKNNTSGVKGVNQHKGRGKWIARCMVDGKSHCLGFFSDITEAEKSVRQFRERNHGEFACHG